MPLNLASFVGRRVLLLQGPMGPFFHRLGALLEEAGATVEKVNFNGGDWLFYPSAEHTFRGSMEEWPLYLHDLVSRGGYDWFLLFGDCRPIHAAAREVAQRHGIQVGVFEEGYLRPNFVTFEVGGVNGLSGLPRTPEPYLQSTSPAPAPIGFRGAYWYMALWAFLYFAASIFRRRAFPHYQHHRPLDARQGLLWLRGLARKYRYRLRERGLQERLVREASGAYFLVPLQVHNDAQVTVHSPFGSVETFVREVLGSFAANAPPSSRLVFKHHPLDRAYEDYTRLISREAEHLGVLSRVHYLHDQHLPTLLEHARGVVVINSTVGLQALDHGKPLKVCGTSLYDIVGLTFQGSLDAFWAEAESFQVDKALYGAFRTHLRVRTQLGGSFYRRLPSGDLLQVRRTSRLSGPTSPLAGDPLRSSGLPESSA